MKDKEAIKYLQHKGYTPDEIDTMWGYAKLGEGLWKDAPLWAVAIRCIEQETDEGIIYHCLEWISKANSKGLVTAQIFRSIYDLPSNIDCTKLVWRRLDER